MTAPWAYVTITGALVGLSVAPVAARGNATSCDGASEARAAAPAGDPVSRTIDLNVQEERITESDFRTSVAWGAMGQSPCWSVQVGGAVTATQINVLLRNVRGRVRYRASLGPVLRELHQRESRVRERPAPLLRKQ